MKLNIKKMILSSCMTMLILNPLSIFAETKEAEEVQENSLLTYESAVEMAIKESNDLKNLKLENESTTIKTDDMLDNFGTSLYNPELLALMKLQKSDNINSEKTSRMENYIKQALAFKIKSTFTNINLMEKDLELKKMQLSNMNKKRDTLALKLEYGMESRTNLTTKDIEINQAKKDIEKLEKELEEQYIELNKSIGYDSFKRYEIEKIALEYEPIKDTQEDIDFKATRAISSDINIWGKEQQLDIQRIDVDFYALNYISGLPSNKQANPTPYKAQDLDSKITSNEIEQAKEDLRKSVIDKYNSIKKLEIAYENTNLKLKELEEKKRILEVAIQAGTAIEQDYNDLLLGINEVNNGIDKIESQHALLVEMYNNPLLAGGSIN